MRIIILLLFLTLINSAQTKASTFHVPIDFSTIQEAVDSSSVGDTIDVAEGTYNEKIVVNKNILIKGSGFLKTIISSNQPDIAVDLSFGTIKCFTIKSLETGMVIRDAAVKNCVIKDVGTNGSFMQCGIIAKGTKNKILNCIIANCKNNAIRTTGSDSVKVVNCIILGNNLLNKAHACYSFDSSVIDISYSCFYRNGIDSVGWIGGFYTGHDSMLFDPQIDSNFCPYLGSPVLNSGDPIIMNSDGSRSDIGVYGGYESCMNRHIQRDGCLIGAYIGCGSSDKSCLTPSEFNQITGKKHGLFSKYIDASNYNDLLSSSHWLWADSLKAIGASPVFFLLPFDSLKFYINGSKDSVLIKFASDCLKFGKRVFVIFGHEMNGMSWYSWCNSGEETDSLYRKAFQRVSNLLKSRADNIMMCWIPIQAWGQNPYEIYYPGSRYVDWVGLNLYDRDWDENNNLSSDYMEAALGYLDFYKTFAVDNNKPMMIAENGFFDANLDPTVNDTRKPLTQDQQNIEKNQWIRQLYNPETLKNLFPKIKAMIYFHVLKDEEFSTQNHNFGKIEVDWRIPLEQNFNVYSLLIQNPYFLDTCFTCTDGVLFDNTLNNRRDFYVFPNPASDKITVYFGYEDITSRQIIIKDIFGREILTYGNISIPQNENNYVDFDISELQSGVYFCTLKSGNYNKTIKFLVTK